MSKREINRLLITAHADDEVIWAGETLLKERGQWEILCIVTPDNQSLFRIPIFKNKIREYLDVSTQMLSFKDTGYYSWIDGDIYTPILNKIKSKRWDRILTHNKRGEYGHLHHIQVHREVLRAATVTNNLDKLWIFDPIKHDNPLILSEEKRKLFEMTYDDESGLPNDHPREWIHGWNTTQGWEEGIKKYLPK